jgi:hypothetical protein
MLESAGRRIYSTIWATRRHSSLVSQAITLGDALIAFPAISRMIIHCNGPVNAPYKQRALNQDAAAFRLAQRPDPSDCIQVLNTDIAKVSHPASMPPWHPGSRVGPIAGSTRNPHRRRRNDARASSRPNYRAATILLRLGTSASQRPATPVMVRLLT